MACNADIPKTTRFYLGDIDAAADSLRDMGYFTQNERDFIAKFVYRYPEAINAVSSVLWSQPKVEGLHISYGAISHQAALPSSNYSPTTVKIESISTSKSKTAVNEAAEKLTNTNEKADVKKLELFVQRCHQRKFSVKSSNQPKIPSPLSKSGSHSIIPEVAIIPPTPIVKAFEPDPSSAEDITERIQRISNGIALESSMQKASIRDHGALHTISEADLPKNPEENAATIIVMPAKKAELPYVGLSDMRDTNLTNYELHHCVPKIMDEEVHCDNNNNDNGDDQRGGSTVSATRTTKWGKPVTDKTANFDGDVVGGSTGADLSRGRAILEKMGWEDGQGLGRDSSGTLEPVIQVVKISKTGLGSGRNNMKFDPTWPSSENNPPPSDSGMQSVWEHASINDEKHSRSYTKGPALPASLTTSNNYGSNKSLKNGIMAKFIKEGLRSGHRDLKLLAHLHHNNEYKKTRHYPGLEIEALSGQQGANSRYPVMKMLQVNVGDRLELLSMSTNNKFAAKIVGTQVKGMVAIDYVRMEEEPVYADEEEEIFGVWTGSSTNFDAYNS